MSACPWPGIRTVIVSAPTEAERLDRLLAVLRSEKQLTLDERRTLESFLYRLRHNEKAMRAISSAGRGRSRGSNAPEIALDYLIHKELLGKASAALNDVANAWNVSELTVKDAYTDWKSSARYRLEETLATHVGKDVRMYREGKLVDLVLTRVDAIEEAAQAFRTFHKLPKYPASRRRPASRRK